MLDDRKRRRFDAVVWSASIAFAILAPLSAYADSERFTNDHAAYRAECGSCHIAYPPALLGAEGWNAIMNGLERHFGTDASVDERTRAELTRYLAAGAGSRRTADATRITEAAWFRKEHRRIDAATWQSAAVKRASACQACHRDAATGDFEEHGVHVPRGGAR
jgi:hypothetical protein